MPSTAIPTRARNLVKRRQMGFCAMCGNAGSEWHHRRRRGVSAGHDPHCPCIGILLCPADHRLVHGNPNLAKEMGYIIQPSEREPWTVPFKSYSGWMVNDCDGNVAFYDRSGHDSRSEH